MKIKTFLAIVSFLMLPMQHSAAECFKEDQIATMAGNLKSAYPNGAHIYRLSGDSADVIFQLMRRNDIQLSFDAEKFIAVVPNDFLNQEVTMFVIDSDKLTCPGFIIPIPGYKWRLMDNFYNHVFAGESK